MSVCLLTYVQMQYRLFPGFPVLPAVVLLVSSGLLCFAGSPESAPSPQGLVKLRESTKTNLAEWQLRLNLVDWKISLEFVPASRLGPQILGTTDWDIDQKTAVMRVLDPADYRLNYNDTLKDMEFTVLHGLIHLEIGALPRTKASSDREDLAVTRLADALLRLDRSPK